MLYQVLLVSFHDIWEPVIHIEIDKDQYGYEPEKMHAKDYVENNREEIESTMESHNLGRNEMS